MDNLTIGKVTVICPHHIVSLIDVHMKARVNEHAVLRIIAIIDEEEAFADIQCQVDDVAVKLIHSDSGAVLFSGLIYSSAVHEANKVFTAEITCCDNSWRFDSKKCSRTFQNRKYKYADMLKDVFADSGIIVNKTDEIFIPTVQYEETDWEFALRMAGNVNTFIVPNYLLDSSFISFGVPKGTAHECKMVEYESGFLSSKYQDFTAKVIECTRNDFYYCKVTSEEDWQLGDKISTQGRTMLVVEKEVVLKGGELINRYVLGSEKGFSAPFHENERLNGLILFATVLARDGESLRVHFDIDKAQKVEDACPIPYYPDSSNVFYSMPIIGSRVAVKFMGDNISVVNCVRLNGEEYSLMNDYNQRYFTTEFKKCFALLTDSLYFEGGSNKSLLDDKAGMRHTTEEGISLLSDKCINLTAQKHVSIHTPEFIKLCQTGEISGIEFAGTEINMYSLDTQIHSGGCEDLQYPPVDVVPAMQMSTNLALSAAGCKVGRLNPRGD